jgi:DNA polymerase-3 subunit gamma/tau
MVLIRIAHAADLPTLDEALKSLGDAPAAAPTQRSTGSGQAPAPSGNGATVVAQARMPTGPGGGQTMRLVEHAPRPAETLAPPMPAIQPVPDVPVKSLEDIAALADANRDALFKAQFKNFVRLVRVEPGRLDVSLTGDAPKTLLGDLKAKLESWTGRRWMVVLSKEEGGPTLAATEAAKRESAFLDARSDPAVAAILAKFPGAKIIDVRIPNAPEAPDEPDLPPEAAPDDDDELDF